MPVLSIANEAVGAGRPSQRSSASERARASRQLGQRDPFHSAGEADCDLIGHEKWILQNSEAHRYAPQRRGLSLLEMASTGRPCCAWP
jgi:hypothetical protein